MDKGRSTRTKSDNGPRGSTWLLGAAVATAAMVAMSGALGGPFIYDDIPLIQGNSYVHDLVHWPRWFSATFVDTNMEPALAEQSRAFFRPLVIASYALDWHWSGGQPWGFHLTNLLIHATNSFLLFLILRGWGVRDGAALVGASTFAVHPTQTETVAWISGRTDGLCLLGLLLATLGLRRIITARAEHRSWLVGGMACLGGLVLAFGSKEAAVVFPALFGIELWAKHCSPLDGPALRRLAAQTAPLLVLTVAYVISRLWLDAGPGVAAPRMVFRIPFILEAVGRYTALVVVPTDFTMGRGSLRYDSGALTPVWAYVALGAFSLSCIAWVAVAQRRKAPGLSLALLATLALLIPVSSVIWLGYDVLVSSRFLYIPMVGVAFAIAAALGSYAPALGESDQAGLGSADVLRQRAIGWVCAMGATALLAIAFLRSLDFSSEDAFWRRELEGAPNSLAAQRHFVGRELREGRPRAGVTLAHQFFSTSPLPEHRKAPLVLEALVGLTTLIPDRSEASLQAVQGFIRELAAGNGGHLLLPALEVSLRIPQGSRLAKALGAESRRLNMLLAEVAARLGDDAEARQRVDQALAGCSDCWTDLGRAALVLAQCGELDRAQELASTVLRLMPDVASHKLLEDLAFARHVLELSREHPSPALTSQYYVALGAFGRAYKAATPAMSQAPADPDALLTLAELSIRAGDVPQARQLLSRRFPPQQVEAEIDEVMRTVPWQDKPRPADEWTPEVVAIASAAP